MHINQLEIHQWDPKHNVTKSTYDAPFKKHTTV